VYFPPYFDHDAVIMHHPMRVLDASDFMDGPNAGPT